jgi:hypothetical protein
MTDRAAWLEQRCAECHAAPGRRCGLPHRAWGSPGCAAPSPQLHVARGWLERPCPTCKAAAGERCSTPSGREASRIHTARLRPSRFELVWRPAVWEELERRVATAAVVPFWGRAGLGGRTDVIRLLCLEGEQLVEVERWTGRDELCYALEAPVWDRFAQFTGHPHVSGEVTWSAENRTVLIECRRGDRRFEELVG